MTIWAGSTPVPGKSRFERVVALLGGEAVGQRAQAREARVDREYRNRRRE